MADNSISLHFGLKEGTKADLEVVAEAALLWVETLRAAAARIDPNAKIRVELIDADEGSLRLNTILEWMEAQLTRIDEGSSKYPRLRKLALALALFVVLEGPSKYEDYFGDDTLRLNDQDRRLIEQLLERTKGAPEVEEPKKKFFRVLERNPAISSVGVSEERKQAPFALVPSSQFAERGGLFAVLDDDGERTDYDILDVILVSPVLRNEQRSWQFEQLEGAIPFSAVMKDARFLAALDESHIQERLRSGIRMTIRVETKRRRVGGVWIVKRGGRSVVEVISPQVD